MQLVDCALERPIGIQSLGANQLVGALGQQRVVEHQQLGGEDGRLGGPDSAGHAGGDFLEFPAGAFAGRAQPLALALDAVGREPVPDLPRLAHGDDRTANGGAGSDAASGERRHASSNPRAASAHSAATAAASSGPSALMRNSVPRAAESSSNPRMLLPSIVRSPRVTLIWL